MGTGAGMWGMGMRRTWAAPSRARVFPRDCAKQNSFVARMIDKSNPVDLKHRRDAKKADYYMRVQNTRGLSSACTSLIRVQSCEACMVCVS